MLWFHSSTMCPRNLLLHCINFDRSDTENLAFLSCVMKQEKCICWLTNCDLDASIMLSTCELNRLSLTEN